MYNARQRTIIKATWAATGATPASYTRYRLSAEGYKIEPQTLTCLDLSFMAMMRVKFPAALDAGVDALKFQDAGASNANTDADLLDFGYCQDDLGADIVVESVQTKLGKSASVNAEIATAFFAIPTFVDSGGDPAAPGVCSVEFYIKE